MSADAPSAKFSWPQLALCGLDTGEPLLSTCAHCLHCKKCVMTVHSRHIEDLRSVTVGGERPSGASASLSLHLTCRTERSDQPDGRSPQRGRDLTLCLLHPLCVDALSLTSDQFIALRRDWRSRCPSSKSICPSLHKPRKASKCDESKRMCGCAVRDEVLHKTG